MITHNIKVSYNKMSLTDFQKVVQFVKISGHGHQEVPQVNVLVDEPDKVTFRMNLIREEMKELEDAVKENNFVEVVDALNDLKYVILGMESVIGINGDKAFDIVHSSNMSKFCDTKEDAEETVKYYKKTQNRYKNVGYKLSEGKYVVYDIDTGKTLKNLYYTPVDFTPLLN